MKKTTKTTKTKKVPKVQLKGKIDTSEPKPLKNQQIAKVRKANLNGWLQKQISGNVVYTPEDVEKIVHKVVERVSSGETLAAILEAKDTPISQAQLYNLGKKDPSVFERISQARQFAQAQKVDSKATMLARTEDLILSGAHDKVANALSSLVKTQCDNVNWNAERFNPSQFSPKLQVQASVEHTVVNITIERPVIDVSTEKVK